MHEEELTIERERERAVCGGWWGVGCGKGGEGRERERERERPKCNNSASQLDFLQGHGRAKVFEKTCRVCYGIRADHRACEVGVVG